MNNFQLPLSGSLEPFTFAHGTLEVPAFNSLSRDHWWPAPGKKWRPGKVLSTPSLGITRGEFRCGWMCSQIPLSTPSLGITRIDEMGIQSSLSSSFNSLSRDHGEKDIIDWVKYRSFQLPLSGSRSVPVRTSSGLSV